MQSKLYYLVIATVASQFFGVFIEASNHFKYTGIKCVVHDQKTIAVQACNASGTNAFFKIDLRRPLNKPLFVSF
jgi:hypothetical protein